MPDDPRMVRSNVEEMSQRIVSVAPENIGSLSPLTIKEREAIIRRQDRQHTFGLFTAGFAYIVSGTILVMAVYYSLTIIRNADSSVDAKHLAFGILGGVLGGAVGYLFGRRE